MGILSTDLGSLMKKPRNQAEEAYKPMDYQEGNRGISERDISTNSPQSSSWLSSDRT